MIKIDSVNAGSSVRFRVSTYDADDCIANADSVPSITVYSGEPAFDTVVLAETVMTQVGLGVYDLWWDTTGMGTDTYLAVAPSVVDAHKNNNRIQIRVLASTV